MARAVAVYARTHAHPSLSGLGGRITGETTRACFHGPARWITGEAILASRDMR